MLFIWGGVGVEGQGIDIPYMIYKMKGLFHHEIKFPPTFCQTKKIFLKKTRYSTHSLIFFSEALSPDIQAAEADRGRGPLSRVQSGPVGSGRTEL